MQSPDTVYTLFKEKAELVSAIVADVQSPRDAFDYAVDLCDRKEACQLLISGCDESLTKKAADLCDAKQQKTIAAPGLTDAQLTELNGLCIERGLELVTSDLREHLAGIDIGFTFVDYGIAETGTLVLDSSSEDLRLATMVSEVHIAVLPRSKLRQSAYDLEQELVDEMQSFPNYTAFITGASRTADIERVLALGVHGPLELHILLLEDA